MKRICIALIGMLMIVGCAPQTSGLETLDEIIEFEIEDDAKVHMAVFDDNFGKELVASWDKYNPKHKGMVSYEVLSRDHKIKELAEIDHFDLVNINHDQVPLLEGHLLEIDSSFNANLSDENIRHLTDVLNQDSIVFMPIGYEGLVFAYNEDMLKAYDISLVDENGDSLPDAIDSFEKIADLKDKFFKDNKYRDIEIEYLFPFPLNDQMAMYPFLQTGEYQFVDGISGESLVVDERLDDSFENLRALGSYTWAKHEDNKNLVWRFEEVMEHQTSPFMMVGNWMYYQQYENNQEYNIRFAKMPAFKDSDLSPLVTVTGFVGNKDTQYPNATQAVLKHLRKIEGIQTLLNAGVIPVIDKTLLEQASFELEENQKDMIVAYGSSQIAPLQAFTQRSDVRVWSMYKEMDFRKEISGVFSKEMSVAEGKQSLITKMAAWLDANAIQIDGVNKNVEDDNQEGNK